MWVCAEFEGDDDENLMLLQHDCYYASLALIRKLLEDDVENPLSKQLPDIRSIDHRTLQGSHDILAAVFRHFHKQSLGYRTVTEKDANSQIGIKENGTTDTEIVNEWQNWLKAWLKSKPTIILQLSKAITFQNTNEGYEAEKLAKKLIRLECSDIAWLETAIDEQADSAFAGKPSSQRSDGRLEEATKEQVDSSCWQVVSSLLVGILTLSFTWLMYLLSVGVIFFAVYKFFTYYLQHYWLALFGMSVGLIIGFLRHSSWVEKVGFGVLYGLCFLIAIGILIWTSGAYDPDCFGPSRYC